MRPAEFRADCDRTWLYTPGESWLLHAALGIAGEAGEVADQVKKLVYTGRPVTEPMIGELGDVLYYLDRIAKYYGHTLEEVMEYNVEKLRKRYQDKEDA